MRVCDLALLLASLSDPTAEALIPRGDEYASVDGLLIVERDDGTSLVVLYDRAEALVEDPRGVDV